MKMPRRKPDDVLNGCIQVWYLELIVADIDGVHKAQIVDGEIVYGQNHLGHWVNGFSPVVSERYHEWRERYERELARLITT